MKKAISLLELILVVSVLSILFTLFIPKILNSLNEATTSQIKSDIALIRNGISKKISSQTLLNRSDDFVLDEQSSQQKNSKLFSNILDYPLIATNSIEKELGKWIKISTNRYIVYFTKDEFLEFRYSNKKFECQSSKVLCEKFE